MGSQTVQNKPTAAFALSLVGGILAMIVGVVLLILAVAFSASFHYYSSFPYNYYNYTGAYLFAGFGIWILICSIIIIVSAAKLNSNPLEHTKWGVLILVFSIIMCGNIFGIIGGALALAYHPQMMGEAVSQYGSQPITRICPQCGRVLSENVRFCPYCGRQLE